MSCAAFCVISIFENNAKDECPGGPEMIGSIQCVTFHFDVHTCF